MARMRTRKGIKIGAFLLALWGLQGAVWAQNSADGVLTRLKGKQLYFRGMFGENQMSFDSSGKALGKYTPVPFTEAGMSVTSVKMMGDQLVLLGRRMGLEFESQGKPRWVRVEAEHYNGNIELKIAGAPGTEYGPALDAIFAADLASLTPSLPRYWQRYAVTHFLPAQPKQDASVKPDVASAGLLHVSGRVRPPKVLESKEPDFTPVAKARRFSGVVQIYLWVIEDGSISHMQITRAAGLGLDEAAMKAVSNYKFAPATLDGKPVKLDLYIDVNFQIR